MNEKGIAAEYLKYGIYGLEPSGPILNGYLREGNPYGLTPREFQIMHVVNRTQYQGMLEEKLRKGIWIVAEDYSPTGIAWGTGAGIDKDFLVRINGHLLKEDLSLYFHGTRFSTGIESVHKHEQDNALTESVARTHEELAEQYHWKKIAANQSQDQVAADVWEMVASLI